MLLRAPLAIMDGVSEITKLLMQASFGTNGPPDPKKPKPAPKEPPNFTYPSSPHSNEGGAHSDVPGEMVLQSDDGLPKVSWDEIQTKCKDLVTQGIFRQDYNTINVQEYCEREENTQDILKFLNAENAKKTFERDVLNSQYVNSNTSEKEDLYNDIGILQFLWLKFLDRTKFYVEDKEEFTSKDPKKVPSKHIWCVLYSQLLVVSVLNKFKPNADAEASWNYSHSLNAQKMLLYNSFWHGDEEGEEHKKAFLGFLKEMSMYYEDGEMELLVSYCSYIKDLADKNGDYENLILFDAFFELPIEEKKTLKDVILLNQFDNIESENMKKKAFSTYNKSKIVIFRLLFLRAVRSLCTKETGIINLKKACEMMHVFLDDHDSFFFTEVDGKTKDIDKRESAICSFVYLFYDKTSKFKKTSQFELLSFLCFLYVRHDVLKTFINEIITNNENEEDKDLLNYWGLTKTKTSINFLEIARDVPEFLDKFQADIIEWLESIGELDIILLKTVREYITKTPEIIDAVSEEEDEETAVAYEQSNSKFLQAFKWGKKIDYRKYYSYALDYIFESLGLKRSNLDDMLESLSRVQSILLISKEYIYPAFVFTEEYFLVYLRQLSSPSNRERKENLARYIQSYKNENRFTDIDEPLRLIFKLFNTSESDKWVKKLGSDDIEFEDILEKKDFYTDVMGTRDMSLQEGTEETAGQKKEDEGMQLSEEEDEVVQLTEEQEEKLEKLIRMQNLVQEITDMLHEEHKRKVNFEIMISKRKEPYLFEILKLRKNIPDAFFNRNIKPDLLAIKKKLKRYPVYSPIYNLSRLRRFRMGFLKFSYNSQEGSWNTKFSGSLPEKKEQEGYILEYATIQNQFPTGDKFAEVSLTYSLNTIEAEKTLYSTLLKYKEKQKKKKEKSTQEIIQTENLERKKRQYKLILSFLSEADYQFKEDSNEWKIVSAMTDSENSGILGPDGLQKKILDIGKRDFDKTFRELYQSAFKYFKTALRLEKEEQKREYRDLLEKYNEMNTTGPIVPPLPTKYPYDLVTYMYTEKKNYIPNPKTLGLNLLNPDPDKDLWVSFYGYMYAYLLDFRRKKILEPKRRLSRYPYGRAPQLLESDWGDGFFIFYDKDKKYKKGEELPKESFTLTDKQQYEGSRTEQKTLEKIYEVFEEFNKIINPREEDIQEYVISDSNASDENRREKELIKIQYIFPIILGLLTDAIRYIKKKVRAKMITEVLNIAIFYFSLHPYFFRKVLLRELIKYKESFYRKTESQHVASALQVVAEKASVQQHGFVLW